MNDDEKKIIQHFCEQVRWVYETWQMQKYLFERSDGADWLMKTAHHIHFFRHLNQILRDYTILQIAKLHDPPENRNNQNLSVPQIIKIFENTPLQETLVSLKKKMEEFAKPCKDARNKIIAHNDLDTIKSDSGLGGFDGEGDQYFEFLINFINHISEHCFNEPFIPGNLVQNDVDIFLSQFNRGAS